MRKLLLSTAILATGGLGFAALWLTRPAPPVQAPEPKVWVVEDQRVTPTTHSPSLPLYGRVETPREAKLTATVTGDVEEVPSREGVHVEKDELLVTLDRRDLRLTLQRRRAELQEIEAQIALAKRRHQSDQQALEQEKALLELTKRGVKRARKLAGQQLGSQASLDTAQEAQLRQALSVIQRNREVAGFEPKLAQLKAQRDQARTRLAEARRDLARTRIQAPFTGRLGRVSVAPGDRVQPGDPLVQIYDTHAMEIRATIPSSRIAHIRRAHTREGTSLPAEAWVDGKHLRAVLDRFAGRSGQDTQGVEALLAIQGRHPYLPLGRSVQLFLQLPPEPKVVKLPFSALYGQGRVYKLVEGRMAAVPVTRVGEWHGKTGQSQVLVRSPLLQTGDRVITTQLPNAMDGLRVRTGPSTS